MKAIILAAGKGTRLLPMTLNKPKPLLEIRGKSILENMIGFLKAANIEDIVVVTGYKSEHFNALQKKLGFKKILLRDYENKNSAASLKCAIDELESGSLILNGDLYITHSFSSYLKNGISQILAQNITQNIPSWGYITDENNKILDIDTYATSGFGDGIAFLDNTKDIEIFKNALLECDDNEYWESCILKAIKKMDFYAFNCPRFYTEIDSFYDALSNHLLTPEEIAIQCSDNGEIERLGGITNINYKIRFLNQNKVIRIPGINTEQTINRKNEKQILELLDSTNIAPQSEFYQSGIKTTSFLEEYKCLESSDLAHKNILPLLVEKLKILHSFKLADYPQFSPILLLDEIKKYENLAKISLTTKKEHKFVLDIARKIDTNYPFVLCHRDLQLPNILFNGRDLQLIDFEYAGFSSIIWELGNLSAELELNMAQIKELTILYGGIDLQEVLEGELISNYIWALWGWIYERIDLGRSYLGRFSNNLLQLKGCV